MATVLLTASLGVGSALAHYAVPGSGRVLWQAALANFNLHAVTQIDFEADRAPLLLIAGNVDNTVPESVVKANVRAQRRSKSITAFKEFPGRSHYIFGQPGWEEVADFALDWALNPTTLE